MFVNAWIAAKEAKYKIDRMDENNPERAFARKLMIEQGLRNQGRSYRGNLVNDNADDESEAPVVRNVKNIFVSWTEDSYGTIWATLSIIIIIAWSCVCAWGAGELIAGAAANPGSSAAKWLEWIESTSESIKMLGVLFTFSLVFRFQTCYNRWWEGRVIWGDIISAALDIDQMSRNWIMDHKYADRFSRFVVVFVYACKAQLRGHRLSSPEEDGQHLVKHGLLHREELKDMKENPCWEPHYALDMLRCIMTQAYVEGGKTLVLDVDHKAHGQLLRCFDNAIVRLSGLIGNAIRVRSAGLPKSYDAIHHILFYIYFTMAPIAWAPTMGWMLPVVIGFVSFISLALINLGTDLVDPFGTDLVDLPLEKYCKTVEVQIKANENRSKREEKMKFATKTQMPILKRESFACSHLISFT